MQIQTKVRCQEAENCRLQQQIEELQQKEEDLKKAHKLKITNEYKQVIGLTCLPISMSWI